MNRLVRPMALLGVASLPTASAIVLAQAPPPPPAPPAPTTTTTTTVEVRKVAVPAPAAKEAVKVRVQVKAAPAPPPPVVVFNGNLGGNNREALLQQFLNQYRAVERGELHLIRSACGLEKDEYIRLARDAEKAFQEAAGKHADEQQKRMMGQARGQVRPFDPIVLIEEAMAGVVSARLAPERAARYRKEVEARAEERKRLGVETLLARLDQDLVLGPDQRAKIGEALSAQWSDDWRSAMTLMQHNAFIPDIPEQCVAPYLSEEQKKVWAGFQRFRGVIWGNVPFPGIMTGAMIQDDDLKGIDLGEARPPAPVGAPGVMIQAEPPPPTLPAPVALPPAKAVIRKDAKK